MNALFRKGLLLVLFTGLVLVGAGLFVMLTAQSASAEDCTVDCTNCSADPVFIQRDYRDIQGLLATKAARAEAQARETLPREVRDLKTK